MSDEANDQPMTMFWVIGGAALVWNLIGVLFFYAQVTLTPETIATFPEDQQAFFNSMPAWATAAHAIAVIGGVAGSVLLLLRKKLAVPVFVISLIGIIVHNLHVFVLARGLEIFGTAGAVLPVIVGVIAIGLVLYSRSAKARGVLS